jgi:DNA-binding CsgD family transcriptional regulator
MTTQAAPVRCPLLIGRDELLELAGRRLDDALSGRGQFLLVSGEAGIGKTRFLDAVDQMAGDRAFTKAWGALAPQDRDLPAASILDLARTMRTVPALAAAGRDLLALREATVGAAPIHRRQLVMDAVSSILGATDGPALYGFEDIQWADDLSLEIIGELSRRARDQRVLLCASYRTDEAPSGTSLRDWRSRLVTQRLAEELRLRPLDAVQTALVTALVLDTGLPAPRDVVDAVYERTDGIPLHIEELLGALSADARANGYAIRQATVPETIEDAVIARLAHRSSEAQAVARAGAVIGRCFVPDVLAGIMDVPVDTVDAPLQELIDHGVLWPPGDRGLFDFRHQLLRDAIYRSVPNADRRRFHARAGEFGTALEGQSEVHSSLHFERAGLRARAFETALAGARDAARLAAHREAFELYRRVIDNLPHDLGHTERAVIYEGAAEEAANIEALDAAADFGAMAISSYRAAGEPARALMAHLLLDSIGRREGRSVTERLASIDASTAEVDGLPADPLTPTLRTDLALFRAVALMDARRLDEARLALDQMDTLAAGSADPDHADVVEWKRGLLDVMTGRVTTGLDRIRVVAAQAEQAGREAIGVSAYRDGAFIATMAMEPEVAANMLDAGLRYADAIEQSHCAHVMAATAAVLAWADGRWSEAIAGAGQAIADRGCRRAAEMARWALGYTALGRGELATAAQELETAWRFGTTAQSIELVLPPLWGLAETALLAGDVETAVQHCAAALADARATGERILLVPFVVTGVRAHLAVGRSLEAATWLADCTDHLAAVAGLAGPAMDHGRGLLAMADGSTGLARPALESAIAGWDARRRVWEATLARLDLAHCLIRSNRFADGLALAVEARTVASRLDAPALADRADALVRMARGRVAVEEPWRPLTSREFAVARLVAAGRTNAEIADELGIAPKTASAHVEHILAKLGASRRTEIASWASHVEGVAAPH